MGLWSFSDYARQNGRGVLSEIGVCCIAFQFFERANLFISPIRCLYRALRSQPTQDPLAQLCYVSLVV